MASGGRRRRKGWGLLGEQHDNQTAQQGRVGLAGLGWAQGRGACLRGETGRGRETYRVGTHKTQQQQFRGRNAGKLDRIVKS